MRPLASEDLKTVRGAILRKDPAREPCFPVVELHTQLHDYAGMSEVSRRQRLHRHMHNEMQNLEIVSQTLIDFPDTPWELRMELARQCWDETRHCSLLYRRLQEIGGYKGEFPVMNYEWGVVCMTDSLAGRLAIQQRTFEGGEMDILRHLVQMWKDSGDEETSQIMDGILADEVQHVRFANRWLKKLAEENPAILLKVVSAVHLLKKVTEALAPDPGEKNAVGVDLTSFTRVGIFASMEDRRLAEFTEEELKEIVRQEGLGSIVS
ncbi:ferritin-like domain-containing protein [bacterium]|nr:ferritin-like domain-containing protein [bacterium]MCI0603571.1 ferritin-like domain-containing protein [bacterium]